MQLTIFGAAGRVGQVVVALALQRGYTVWAFVHSHEPFEPDDNLTVIKGDVSSAKEVAAAITGSDSVISTLGSWGTKDKDILTKGMETIIPAMGKAGVSRLITLTGSGASWSGDYPSLFDKSSHLLLGLVAPKILKDGEAHLRLLEASKLDWTCIRAPVMKDTGSVEYQLKLKLSSVFAKIPRPAVAQCLIDQLESPEYIHQAPVIYRR